MDSITHHALEFSLLNDYQHGFPLCSAPFARLAQELGSTEAEVLTTCAKLLAAGRISRVGAVFAPGRVGASTLAAIRVAPERLAQVAAMVSQFAEVNHNYEREHRFNLWFVVTSSSPERLSAVLAQIASRCALPVMCLPLEEEFHIDLGFKLEHQRGCGVHGRPTLAKKHAPRSSRTAVSFVLDAQGQALINALQGGLPLVARPYAQLAQQLNWPEPQVLKRLGAWLEAGILKRFGVVVRHHELGYTANAMVVHDIPDALVSALGQTLGQHPAVTLCYRRPRQGGDWPYNLFCMLHGRDRSVVEAQIAQLRADFALQAYPHEVLFSRTRYKQQGAYYADDAVPDRPVTALAA